MPRHPRPWAGGRPRSLLGKRSTSRVGAPWTSWERAGRTGSASERWCPEVSAESRKDRSLWPENTQDQEARFTGTRRRGLSRDLGHRDGDCGSSRLPAPSPPASLRSAGRQRGGEPGQGRRSPPDPPLTAGGCGSPARLQDPPAHLGTASTTMPCLLPECPGDSLRTITNGHGNHEGRWASCGTLRGPLSLLFGGQLASRGDHTDERRKGCVS